MKVIHIIVGLETGGAETMLKKLVQHPSSVEHVVVSLTTCGPIGQQIVDSGNKVYALQMRGLPGVPMALWRLARIIRGEHANVAQTWMYHADLLGGLVAAVVGIPVFWGVRTTELPRERSRATRIIRTCCAFLSNVIPKKIIYPAESSRILHESLGYSVAKSIVIPNGFDLETLQDGFSLREEMRRKFGLQTFEPALGFIGRFHDDKDPYTFLRAMALLFCRVGSLKIVMIGRGFDYANRSLRSWIDELGLRGRVLLLGERPDVPACLGAIDVFCLASKTEGFPNVLGEAMGVGIPCVATDVGDVRVVLGDCGVVVPREDPTALADGVAQVLAWTPTERAARIELARERIADAYSIEATVKRFETLYFAAVIKGEDQCAA
jgi:glycosyltransferase involved in cell wall biosynthesis